MYLNYKSTLDPNVFECELLEDGTLFDPTFTVHVKTLMDGEGYAVDIAPGKLKNDPTCCINSGMSLKDDIPITQSIVAINNCDYLKNFKSKSGKFNTLSGEDKKSAAKPMPSIKGHNHSMMKHNHKINDTFEYKEAEVTGIDNNGSENKVTKGTKMLGVFVGMGYTDLRIIHIDDSVNLAI